MKEIKSILIGGRSYLDQSAFLDFLNERAYAVVKGLRVKGTSPTETEFLRGQSFEIESIKSAIQPPTQSDG